jgi:F-type H+-transporting ATPase subunit delta
MSNLASAGRYAKALLDVAAKQADPVRAEQDLSEFAALVAQNADLRNVLENPAIPVSAKRAVVEQLVARAKPSAPVGKLLMLLAERDRLALLPDLAAAYRERLLDYQNVVRAEVVTALPLPDAQAKQLQEKLARVTGRTVRMTTRTDQTIIGGLVAKVGSTVYDGSVATQLQRMRERLVEGA